MQKKIQILTLTIIALLGGNISRAQGQTQEELTLQRMQDKINSMEKGMATMQQELYRNSGKKGKMPISEEPLGVEDERARSMNGKVEELEHNVNTIAAKLDKIITDIDFRISALEKKASAAAVPEVKPDTAPDAIVPPDVEKQVDKSGEEKAEVAAPAKVAAADQYDRAFELLRLTKYEDAEHAFRDFIAANKGNDLVGNAYYWLGETFYARKNYQQAAVNFLKGYQDFPKGNKAADNLFKLSMSLKGLKKTKESCATIEKMKKEYPKADKELLSRAEAEKKELKCK